MPNSQQNSGLVGEIGQQLMAHLAEGVVVVPALRFQLQKAIRGFLLRLGLVYPGEAAVDQGKTHFVEQIGDLVAIVDDDRLDPGLHQPLDG